MHKVQQLNDEVLFAGHVDQPDKRGAYFVRVSLEEFAKLAVPDYDLRPFKFPHYLLLDFFDRALDDRTWNEEHLVVHDIPT